jgi:hypothetical protein
VQPVRGTNYAGFIAKVAIVTVIVALGITYVADAVLESVFSSMRMLPLKEKVRKVTRDERTQVRLRGLLTHNPAVHFRAAALEEERGDLKDAIEEIELALGLLELHSADRAIQEKYQARLQELKRKQAGQLGSDAKR